MDHFGTSTARIAAFREGLLNAPAYISAERGVLYTQAHRVHKAEPIVLQRAHCVANVLDHMTIFIEPQTLLAGNQASRNRAAPLFPEYCMDWVVDEVDTFSKRDGDVFEVTPEDRAAILELGEYWQNITLKDKGLAALPPEKRVLFVRRYWYFDSVAEIAARLGRTENQVSVALSRLRRKLRKHLLEGGFEL